MLSLPYTGVTLRFLRRNLGESVQGGVRYDGDIILGMVVLT